MGMDVPTPAVSDVEHDEATQNSDCAKESRDCANIADDPALTLEEQARLALECPCVADLVKGPCGEELSKAFGCFIKSQEPEKGSDCVETFEKMQKCMITNAREFSSVSDSDPDVSSIEREHRRETEKDLDGESENKGEEVSGLRNGKQEREPPEVVENAIRLPLWSLAEDLENLRSR